MRPALWFMVMLTGVLLLLGGAYGLYVRDQTRDAGPVHGIDLNTWLNGAMLVLTGFALFVALRSYEGAVESGRKQEKALDASRAALDSMVEHAKSQQILLADTQKILRSQLVLLQQEPTIRMVAIFPGGRSVPEDAWPQGIDINCDDPSSVSVTTTNGHPTFYGLSVTIRIVNDGTKPLIGETINVTSAPPVRLTLMDEALSAVGVITSGRLPSLPPRSFHEHRIQLQFAPQNLVSQLEVYPFGDHYAGRSRVLPLRLSHAPSATSSK